MTIKPYLTQIKHTSFNGVTQEFKNNIVINNVSNYLNSTLKEKKHTLTEVQDQIDKFNNYSFELGGDFKYDKKTNSVYFSETQVLDEVIIQAKSKKKKE